MTVTPLSDMGFLELVIVMPFEDFGLGLFGKAKFRDPENRLALKCPGLNIVWLRPVVLFSSTREKEIINDSGVGLTFP